MSNNNICCNSELDKSTDEVACWLSNCFTVRLHGVYAVINPCPAE